MAELWRNWSGQVRCAPAAVERPASEEELREVVARAAERGQRVRAVGSGHSFNDIACTDGVMLRLDRLGRMLDADRASGLVRVQAGIALHELGRQVDALGLAQENQGDIDRQTLGGALATGTHGTGSRFANLSSQVAALRLVAGDGEVVECSAESEPELFRAARVGLGCAGILSEVTLRCLPSFTLERIDRPRPLTETLAAFDELTAENDHFELFVFPYAEVALTRATNRVEREPAPPGAAERFLEDVVLENWAMEAVSRLGRRFPAAIPALNRGVTRLLTGGRRTDRMHRLFPNRRDVRFTEMEYAIPREHGVEAVSRVLELVPRRRLAVGFPIEVRVGAGDDAYLSPAHGRDTCYVAVHVYRGMEYEQYFRAVEAIMDEYEGRPHWGKRHYQSAATLAGRYAEWDAFQAALGRLDPQGVLRNEYVDRVLGPLAELVRR